MNLPFTPEQFFDVFTQYNLAVWPMQVVIYGLAVIALLLTGHGMRYSSRVVAVILAFFWLWMGLVYHLVYFTSINKAAYIFGGLFIVQAILFFSVGMLSRELQFRFHPNKYAIIGSVFILYGMLIYPLLGYALGHRYPAAPTFGLPCPTTIFTFGLLLWTDKRVPKYLLVIPIIWSIIGFFAALQLGVGEDVMLLVIGVATLVMLWYRDMWEARLSRILPV
jgi:hypothetical protein